MLGIDKLAKNGVVKNEPYNDNNCISDRMRTVYLTNYANDIFFVVFLF